MCALKAAGLSFNFSNVIQVVMSVSRCMLRLTFGGLILYSCHQHASHLVYQMAAKFDREVFKLACKILQGNTISSLYWVIYSMV